MSIFAKISAYRIRQQAVRKLSSLDDRTLSDIGLTRGGIHDAIFHGR
jgi:uncharacterized protein YjiS (DUF1127 family)